MPQPEIKVIQLMLLQSKECIEQDSNSQPYDHQAKALPTELTWIVENKCFRLSFIPIFVLFFGLFRPFGLFPCIQYQESVKKLRSTL